MISYQESPKNNQLITIEGYETSPERSDMRKEVVQGLIEVPVRKLRAKEMTFEAKSLKSDGADEAITRKKLGLRNDEKQFSSVTISKSSIPKPKSVCQSYQSLKKHLSAVHGRDKSRKTQVRSQSENFNFKKKLKKSKNFNFLKKSRNFFQDNLNQMINDQDLNNYNEQLSDLKKQLEEVQSSNLDETQDLSITDYFPITEYLSQQKMIGLSRKELEKTILDLRRELAKLQKSIKEKDQNFLELKIANSKLQSQVYYQKHQNESETEDLAKNLNEKILNFEVQVKKKLSTRDNSIEHLEFLIGTLGSKFKVELERKEDKIKELEEGMDQVHMRVESVIKENLRLRKLLRNTGKNASRNESFCTSTDESFKRRNQKQGQLIKIKGKARV